MWTEKTPTGKYKYSERYPDPMTGKLKKVSVTLPGNRNKDVNAAREIGVKLYGVQEHRQGHPRACVLLRGGYKGFDSDHQAVRDD